MAPKKAAGGASRKPAQNYVTELWRQGLSEQDIRKQLKDYGYKTGRISQLIKATRPTEAQEGVVAVSAVARKRPAAASGSRDRPAESDEEAGQVFLSHGFDGGDQYREYVVRPAVCYTVSFFFQGI